MITIGSSKGPTAYDTGKGGDFMPLPATSTSPGQNVKESGDGGYVKNGPYDHEPWKTGKI